MFKSKKSGDYKVECDGVKVGHIEHSAITGGYYPVADGLGIIRTMTMLDSITILEEVLRKKRRVTA